MTDSFEDRAREIWGQSANVREFMRRLQKFADEIDKAAYERGVADERERCAKVAEGFHREDIRPECTYFDELEMREAFAPAIHGVRFVKPKKIAAAIRKGT